MSAIDRPPSSQFYWKDWLADSDLRRMTFDERGRYVDVLALTHQTDTPGVCSEDDMLRWTKYSRAQWKKHRMAFARLFTVKPDGTWIQESVVAAREAQRRRFAKSKQGGLASAARPRDSRGRLVARQDTGLEPGLEDRHGTPAVAPAFASPKLKKNQPNARARAALKARKAVTPNSAASEQGGPTPVGEILATAMSSGALCSESSGGSRYTEDFLDRQQAQFPELDVRMIAAGLREQIERGEVREPEALLVYRCKKARAEAMSSSEHEAMP